MPFEPMPYLEGPSGLVQDSPLRVLRAAAPGQFWQVLSLVLGLHPFY